MKYEITLMIDAYTMIDGEYKRVEVEKKFVCSSWDEAKDLLGLLIEASESSLSFKIVRKGLENE